MAKPDAPPVRSTITTPARRAGFAAVLSGGMASSTYIQYVFGVLASLIIDDFGITRSQLGLLTTTAFVAGALGSTFAGAIVDRVGGRRVFIASLVLVAAATLEISVAPTYLLALAGSLFMGGALACCNPTTNKLIAHHLPAGARGVITGLKQAGVQVGAFVTGLLVPAIANVAGWRPAFASMAAFPLVTVLGTLVVVPPDDEPVAAEDRPQRERLSATVWWMAAYALLMGAGVAAVGTYLPLYAREEVGLSVTTAGALAAVIGAIGIVSRVAWGWGSERTGQLSIPLAIMGAGAVVATTMVASAPTNGDELLWVGAVLFGATAVTWNAVGMLAIVVEFESSDAGRASGIVQAGFYAGFVVFPATFGYTVDTTGSYGVGWSMTIATFALATIVAIAWQRFRSTRP